MATNTKKEEFFTLENLISAQNENCPCKFENTSTGSVLTGQLEDLHNILKSKEDELETVKELKKCR